MAMLLQTVAGTLNFEWEPDEFDIPMKERRADWRRTYHGGAHTSFGLFLRGTTVSLKWKWMPADQFDRLQEMLSLGRPAIWWSDQPSVPGAVVPTTFQFAVELISLDGRYFEVVGTHREYRERVRLDLLILSDTEFPDVTPDPEEGEWELVAGHTGGLNYISDMVEFTPSGAPGPSLFAVANQTPRGTIPTGASSCGTLLRFTGTAWEVVAAGDWPIDRLVVYEGDLYGGTRGTPAGAPDPIGAKLYRWDQVSAWETEATWGTSNPLARRWNIVDLIVGPQFEEERIFALLSDGMLLRYPGSVEGLWHAALSPSLLGGAGGAALAAVAPNNYYVTSSGGAWTFQQGMGSGWSVVVDGSGYPYLISRMLARDGRLWAVTETAGDQPGGHLLRHTAGGASSWAVMAQQLVPQISLVGFCAAEGPGWYAGAVRSGLSGGGRVVFFNNLGWEYVGGLLGNETQVLSLCRHDGYLYAGTGPNGLLYRFQATV